MLVCRAGELMVDPVGDETEFDLRQVQIPKVIDQIAPRIVQTTDRGDKGDNAAYLKLVSVHHPPPNQQCCHNLQMAAQVHQKIHRKLEFEDPHIELQDTVDPFRVRFVLLGRGRAAPDGADPELPYTDLRKFLDTSVSYLRPR